MGIVKYYRNGFPRNNCVVQFELLQSTVGYLSSIHIAQYNTFLSNLSIKYEQKVSISLV